MRQAVIGFEIEHTAKKENGVPFVLTREHLPYPKNKPLWVGDAGNVQLDCVLAETATNPATDPETTWAMYEELKAKADSLMPDGVVLGLESVLEYNSGDLLQSKDAMEIGCSASYDAYDPDGAFAKSVTPTEYGDNYRYAGLHVNIDFAGDNFEKIKFIRSLDKHLGEYSALNWEKGHEAELAKRRKLYGMAGNYRLTEFGVEYRTLPALVWCKENVKKIYELVAKALENPTADGGEDTRNLINHVGATL